MVTDRLILVAQNKDFPRLRDLVVCPDCGGTGYDYEYYNCPIEQITRHRKVPCGTCNGEGAYEKPVRNGASRPPAGAPVSTLRGDRSTTSPSGMTPDAGATAVLSRSTLVGSNTHVLRKCSDPKASEVPAANPAPKSSPRGTLDRVMDVVTVFAGMVVFSGLAFFLLVLA